MVARNLRKKCVQLYFIKFPQNLVACLMAVYLQVCVSKFVLLEIWNNFNQRLPTYSKLNKLYYKLFRKIKENSIYYEYEM